MTEAPATPPGSLRVKDVVRDPANPARRFAATYGGGVFASDDGGASWAAQNAGLP